MFLSNTDIKRALKEVEQEAAFTRLNELSQKLKVPLIIDITGLASEGFTASLKFGVPPHQRHFTKSGYSNKSGARNAVSWEAVQGLLLTNVGFILRGNDSYNLVLLNNLAASMCFCGWVMVELKQSVPEFESNVVGGGFMASVRVLGRTFFGGVTLRIIESRTAAAKAAVEFFRVERDVGVSLNEEKMGLSDYEQRMVGLQMDIKGFYTIRELYDAGVLGKMVKRVDGESPVIETGDLLAMINSSEVPDEHIIPLIEPLSASNVEIVVESFRRKLELLVLRIPTLGIIHYNNRTNAGLKHNCQCMVGAQQFKIMGLETEADAIEAVSKIAYEALSAGSPELLADLPVVVEKHMTFAEKFPRKRVASEEAEEGEIN